MLEQIAKDIADSVKKSVKAAIDAFSTQIEPRLKAAEECKKEFEATLKALDDSIEAKLKVALESLPAPKDGEDGEDGKSIDIADVKTMVDVVVESAIKELPKPKDGEDGKTPEPEAVKAMIDELVSAKIAEIPKPKDGEDGKSVDPDEVKAFMRQAAADAVAALPPAKDGESVSPEQVKAMLQELVKEAVAAIELPKPENGRDALDIEILPSIDETVSYARGVYATHRGGLWKSFKKTSAMNGWECIVDGIYKTVVVREDDRSFAFITERASGTINKLPFEVEGMRYKKVYRDGQEYNKGDTVTWAGSLWYCNEKTKDKPGEGSEAWTLAAKKGRDHNPKIKV